MMQIVVLFSLGTEKDFILYLSNFFFFFLSLRTPLNLNETK